VSPEANGFVPDLCRRFAAHLAGTPVDYADVPVEVEALSAFQQELLAAARSIGWGDVVTYGSLAALAGRPRAARAAGTFCAGNTLSLVVPCHRVVGAGRGEPYVLGGYGPSGAALKRRLLALEGTLL
jgi:methylated-DNA-[protein]-cysteine S-methyltransferase